MTRCIGYVDGVSKHNVAPCHGIPLTRFIKPFSFFFDVVFDDEGMIGDGHFLWKVSTTSPPV
jgi:hypothetical protein